MSQICHGESWRQNKVKTGGRQAANSNQHRFGYIIRIIIIIIFIKCHLVVLFGAKIAYRLQFEILLHNVF